MRSSILNRHISMSGRLLTCSVLILYILISVTALTCVESMGSDHHHTAMPLDHSSHSLLCALACQANISASLFVAMVGLFVTGCWLAAYGSSPRALVRDSIQWGLVRGPPLSGHSLF